MPGGKRKGSGRPRELEGRQDICVTLDAPSLARLSRWCDTLGLSRSEALRLMIARAREPKPRKRKGEP